MLKIRDLYLDEEETILKKNFIAIITFVLLISSMAGVVSAAEASPEMTKAIETMKKEEFSNFKEGSLKLTDVQEVSVNDPELNTSTVQMALAEYTTVRDSIFPTVRKEIVYFDPENGEVLHESQLATVDEVSAYKDSYDGETGAKLQMGLIITLLIVLPIAYILFIMLVWEPRQYSVTKFKIANRLFHGESETYQ